MRFTPLVTTVLAAMPVIARAQDVSDTLSLRGRSTISLGLGLTGNRSTSTSVAGLVSHTSGQVASLAFSHWVRPTVAVEISAAVLNADASVSGGRVHDNAITPILFGLSVSPRTLALSGSVRPYLSAAAGPYIHMVSDVYGGSTSTTVETAPGGRLAAGANMFLSRHFVFGVEGNYHAVGDFNYPGGVTEKASGFGMSMSFGFAWGGR